MGLSQHSEISESIVVLQRHPKDAALDTRIISLDRLPTDDIDAEQLFKCINGCETGTLPAGWGEVSRWPAERIAEGDWTGAMWRSSELAAAAAEFAAHHNLADIGGGGGGRRVHKTQPAFNDSYRRTNKPSESR